MEAWVLLLITADELICGFRLIHTVPVEVDPGGFWGIYPAATVSRVGLLDVPIGHHPPKLGYPENLPIGLQVPARFGNHDGGLGVMEGDLWLRQALQYPGLVSLTLRFGKTRPDDVGVGLGVETIDIESENEIGHGLLLVLDDVNMVVTVGVRDLDQFGISCGVELLHQLVAGIFMVPTLGLAQGLEVVQDLKIEGFGDGDDFHAVLLRSGF
jgi:hypothetical protein